MCFINGMFIHLVHAIQFHLKLATENFFDVITFAFQFRMFHAILCSPFFNTVGKFHNDSLTWTEEIKKTEDKGNDQLPKVISSGQFLQLGMVQMRHKRETSTILQSHCLRGQFNCKESDLKMEEICFQEMSYTP